MQKSSIEQRLARVSISTWGCTLIILMIQLLSVPICLRYWGKDNYGMWLAVLAAFTMLRTSDYGYVLYIGNKLNVLYHKSDYQLRLTLASSIWGIIVLGVIQLIVLVILYACNSMELLMGHRGGVGANLEIFTALLIMSIGWIIFSSYTGIVHRLLNPHGLLHITNWMMIILQIMLFFAVITSAILKLSILSTSILYTITQVVFYLFSAVYMKSILPEYYPWWKNAQIKVGITDIFNSFSQTLGWIMTQGGLSALIITISAFLGPAAVPAYTTLRTISNLWTTLINSFTQPMIPEMVRFYATADWKRLAAINNIYWVLGTAIVNLSLLVFYPLIHLVFKIWTGNHLHYDKPLLSLLLAAITVSAMSALMNAFFTGINNYSYVLISSALRGLFVLILCWFLLPKVGTLGLGISILLAEILVLIATMFFMYLGILNKSESKIWGWAWISSASVIIYFISQCFSDKSISIIYYIVLLICLISLFKGWHGLGSNIKARIKSLILRRL